MSWASLATDVVATPEITVGFVGSELTIDPAYEQRATALTYAKARERRSEPTVEVRSLARYDALIA